MKVLATAILLTATSCAATALADPDTQTSTNSPQHEWLLQLVGDWEASTEAITEPGGEPSRWQSSEHVRAIGNLWIVAEGSITDEDQPFASMQTIGFDPEQGAFVSSWVDSIQTRMVTYQGNLDDEKRVLTFEAEWPSIGDPSKQTRYRDQLELIDLDHKRMTSSVLGDDGEWQTYMTVDYRRKK